MTITTYSAKSSVALLSITLLLLLISSSSSSPFFSNINVLKSGQRLDSGSFLSYGNYVFAMQADCNLVLYSNNTVLWSSHTEGNDKDCYLSLVPNGELYIYGDGDKMVWRSETGGDYGHYALVLQPNASTLLSSSILLLLIASCSSTSFGNLLKPSDGLRAGELLSIGDYKFAMQRDCNLVLYENDSVLWASKTQGMGTNCRLYLQSTGELLIISGLGIIVWRSETGTAYGNYVLVLQPNGNVVIYGSSVWSTGTVSPVRAIHAPPPKTLWSGETPGLRRWSGGTPASGGGPEVLAGSSTMKLDFVHSTFKGSPALLLKDSVVSELAASFTFTLVGKFMLKRPNLDVIRKFFANLKLTGCFTVGLLDQRHIAIQLNNDLDYSRIFSRRV
ncbi:hypothetical protein M5K25_011825 [Dendrobium thyrsiflorum]|uniref:Bulb-type lectin domain-containing protein n=1 Tax=Dendrobium thyrsiflorum TaxID=117978 RepID=A0ABD0V464_DENTH